RRPPDEEGWRRRDHPVRVRPNVDAGGVRRKRPARREVRLWLRSPDQPVPQRRTTEVLQLRWAALGHQPDGRQRVRRSQLPPGCLGELQVQDGAERQQQPLWVYGLSVGSGARAVLRKGAVLRSPAWALPDAGQLPRWHSGSAVTP